MRVRRPNAGNETPILTVSVLIADQGIEHQVPDHQVIGLSNSRRCRIPHRKLGRRVRAEGQEDAHRMLPGLVAPLTWYAGSSLDRMAFAIT